MNVQELLTNYQFNIEPHNDKALLTFNDELQLLSHKDLAELGSMCESVAHAISTYINMREGL